MKTSSWPKPNSKTTPYSNFFTFFDHPDLYHGTTLNKRPKIGHGDDTTLNNSPKTNDTEPSETSPFKGIHSTSLSANETNEDHNRIVGFFLGWDQKDRTLPEGPPSPNGSDTSVSVGSNTHIITSVSVATRQLLDIEAQTGNANSEDWQEEIYQKIEVMKEAYLPELTEMYDKCAGKLQQQPEHEQFEKLKIFTTMLERVLQFLQVPKSNILPNFKEKLPSYEKQIVNFLNLNWPRKPGLSLQQGQPIPPPHIQSMQRSQQSQSQITQVHPMHENQMNPHLQSMNLQGSSVATMQQNKVATLQHNSLSSLSGVPTTSQSMISTLQPGSTIDSASLDSTAQRGNANSGDWQEEIYQKIEVMKEAYLPELTEMYHKIVGKLQQQPKHEQFEKLEIFKAMLERILQFLQVPKSNILPNFKEKLPAYEKQIVNFLNSNKPRKPGPSLQQGQQIPPPPKKRRLS